MNKKTYGEGVRVERVDHKVVAETIAAKEKLRDQLGQGEEVRKENISEEEFLQREVVNAAKRLVAASRKVMEAAAEEDEALEKYNYAINAWRASKEGK